MTIQDALDAYAMDVKTSLSQRDVCIATETITNTLIGHKLFTIMQFDAEQMMVQRIYSSNPTSYPVGGQKPKRDTDWGRHVLEKGKVYIGYNDDDIRWAFDDSDVILGLDLHAVLNVPIRAEGKIVGTMNLLDRTARYNEEKAEIALLVTEQLARIFT